MGMLLLNNTEDTKKRTNTWRNSKIDKIGIQKIKLGSTMIILFERQLSSAMKRKDPAVCYPS